MKLEYTNNQWFDENSENKMLREFADNDINIHSLIFAHEGKIFYEKYWGMNQGTLHLMYSIAKSVTAIAIGFLSDKNIINLDDTLWKYISDEFDQAMQEQVDDRNRRVTFRDALTMRTSHSKTTYKLDPSKDWVKSFFLVPSDKEPGISFSYDTSGTHVLGYLVKKLSGMGILELIKEQFPELGLSSESYMMKDPFGVENSGSGLMCTTQDLLRIGIFLQNEGCINGRQMISQEYMKAAISKQADSSVTAKHDFEMHGYGYYIWRLGHNGYMCYGKDGQFICIYPDSGMIMISTADTSKCSDGNNILINSMYRLILANERVYRMEKNKHWRIETKIEEL